MSKLSKDAPRDIIASEESAAKDYIISLAKEAISDQPDEVKNVINKAVEILCSNAKEWHGDCFFWRMERSKGSFFDSWKDAKFNHVFDIGESGRATYSLPQRLRLRKDGTVNTALLKKALLLWAYRKIREAKSETILAENRKILASVDGISDCHKVNFGLSETRKGECKASYEGKELRFVKHNLAIAKIVEFNELCERLEQEFVNATGSMTASDRD